MVYSGTRLKKGPTWQTQHSTPGYWQTTMSKPRCTICGWAGFGIEFPMFPKAAGFKFGTICVKCDKTKTEANR